MDISRDVNRCTGHCCREFTLHSGDDKVLNADRERWLAEGKMNPEVRQIMEMVIPLQEHEDEGGMFYTTFTCKNFDVEEQSCLIYKDRPEMCRRFGAEEVECNHEGCTYARP